MGCLMNRARWRRLAAAAATKSLLRPSQSYESTIPTLETYLMALSFPKHVSNLRGSKPAKVMFLSGIDQLGIKNESSQLSITGN